MLLKNKLYRRLARHIEVLPTGKRTASKILNLWGKKDVIWDPWILKDGDIYRLFYLVGEENSEIWWKCKTTIHSAISTDLKTWKDLGTALAPDPANSWESGRMLAGCAYKEGDVYYLFYSAAGNGDIESWHEGIGLATSTDGLHWQRYSTKELIKPEDSNPWYCKQKYSLYEREEYDHFQWRDPYIVKDEKTGNYYMYICAYLKAGREGKFRGCIGLAVASTITGPYKLLPPAAAPIVEGTNESPFYEMERPQVIYKNGKYNLFFSTWSEGLNPKWTQKVGWENISRSSLYWYISDCIDGPFEPVSEKPICIGSDRTGIYGTNFLSLSEDPEEFIAYGWYHRLMTLGISPVFKVKWSNDSIVIS